MMKNFNFKYKNPLQNGPYANGPHLLGLLLVPIGLFFLIAPTFNSAFDTLGIGIGAIVLGIIILSTYGGVMISFNDRKIKEYYSYCGYKNGEWLPLPEQISIHLISYTYKSTNTANGISPTFSGKVTEYRTSLYEADSEEPVVSFRYTNKEQALEHAKLLSKQLGAGLEIQLADE